MEIELMLEESETDAVLQCPDDLTVRELWQAVADHYGVVPSIVAMVADGVSGIHRVRELARLSPESDQLLAELNFADRPRVVVVELPV